MSTKAVNETELKVFVRAGNYKQLDLGEGVRLFVAETPAAATGGGSAFAKAPGASAAAAATAAVKAPGSDDGAATDVVIVFGDDARPPRTVDGFVLLDPQFKDGKVIGYVISLNRMRPDAHSGTLKLLYDEVGCVCGAVCIVCVADS